MVELLLLIASWLAGEINTAKIFNISKVRDLFEVLEALCNPRLEPNLTAKRKEYVSNMSQLNSSTPQVSALLLAGYGVHGPGWD